MRKYRALLFNDIRQISTDPMLMASVIGPLALLFISRYLFPSLDEWLVSRFGFQFLEHASFISSFLLIIIPLLPGAMAGLLMLDDRDENMIAYYAVTPLARAGFFRYRLFLPSMLTLFTSVLFILYSGLTQASLVNVFTLLLLVIEAPLLALFLASFASNKVEGLALSKASAILYIGPIAAYFVPEPWSYIGGLIPSYWTAQSFLTGDSGQTGASLGWFTGGLAIHVALLAWLIRVFLKRLD